MNEFMFIFKRVKFINDNEILKAHIGSSKLIRHPRWAFFWTS